MRMRYLSSLLLLSLSTHTYAADAPEAPMQFSYRGNGGNCNGCEWLSAEGRITADTPAAFKAFLKDNGVGVDGLDKMPMDIQFHSSGGDLAAALELGRLLSQTNWNASIARSAHGEGVEKDSPIGYEDLDGAVCQGSCAYAILGANQRAIDDVKTYQPNLPTSAELGGRDALQSMAQLAAYLSEMGVGGELLTATAPLGEERLKQLHITTHQVDGADWRLEPNGASLVAMVSQKQTGARNPDTVNAILSCGEAGKAPLKLVFTQRLGSNIKADEFKSYFEQLEGENGENLELDLSSGDKSLTKRGAQVVIAPYITKQNTAYNRLSIQLDQKEWEQLLVDPVLRVSLTSAGRPNQGAFDYWVSTKRAKELGAVVIKDCAKPSK